MAAPHKRVRRPRAVTPAPDAVGATYLPQRLTGKVEQARDGLGTVLEHEVHTAAAPCLWIVHYFHRQQARRNNRALDLYNRRRTSPPREYRRGKKSVRPHCGTTRHTRTPRAPLYERLVQHRRGALNLACVRQPPAACLTLPFESMIFSCASSPLWTMTTRGWRMPNLFTFTTSKN